MSVPGNLISNPGFEQYSGDPNNFPTIPSWSTFLGMPNAYWRIIDAGLNPAYASFVHSGLRSLSLFVPSFSSGSLLGVGVSQTFSPVPFCQIGVPFYVSQGFFYGSGFTNFSVDVFPSSTSNPSWVHFEYGAGPSYNYLFMYAGPNNAGYYTTQQYFMQLGLGWHTLSVLTVPSGVSRGTTFYLDKTPYLQAWGAVPSYLNNINFQIQSNPTGPMTQAQVEFDDI